MSGQPAGALSSKQKSDIRQKGRRRAFMFVYVLVAIVFFIIIMNESANFSHAVDDQADVALTLVSIVVFALTWRSSTVEGIKKANLVATIVGVLIIVATIYATVVEIGTPADFGDDLPTFVLGIVAVLNGVL